MTQDPAKSKINILDTAAEVYVATWITVGQILLISFNGPGNSSRYPDGWGRFCEWFPAHGLVAIVTWLTISAAIAIPVCITCMIAVITLLAGIRWLHLETSPINKLDLPYATQLNWNWRSLVFALVVGLILQFLLLPLWWYASNLSSIWRLTEATRIARSVGGRFSSGYGVLRGELYLVLKSRPTTDADLPAIVRCLKVAQNPPSWKLVAL